MPREEVVVPHREFSFSGVFSVEEVHDIIYRFLTERDYTRIEKLHEHKKFADGSVIEIKAEHKRSITDHDKFEFHMSLTFSQIKDIEVAVNHEKKKVNSGKFHMSFRGILFADDHNEWGAAGWNRKIGPFIRWIADKFVFSEHTSEIVALCKKDVDDLYDRISEYFKAQAYRRQI